MNILCIGEALIDMVCTDKDSPLSHGTHFQAKPGGAPANVAAFIGVLGGETALAAKIGNDAFGDKLIHTLESFGVSTRWISRSNEYFTTMAFVSLMQNGERDFIFNRGADGMLTTEELDTIPLQDTSIIHFGSATAFLAGPLQTAYRHMLQKTLAQNKIVSFDPNYRQLLFPANQESFVAQSQHFLSNCHFCKCSEEEALMLTGKAIIAEAAALLMARSNAVITVTLGSRGSLLCLNGEIFDIPAIPTTCIDSTGAGDAFVGAVLYQLRDKTPNELTQLSPGDWHRIIAEGNKAGAHACTYFGAMPEKNTGNQSE
jgi:fructokinase